MKTPHKAKPETNPEYDLAQSAIDEHNTKASDAALEQFANSETAALFGNQGTYMVGVLTDKITTAKRGNPIYPFTNHERELLTTMLGTDTQVSYDSYGPTDADPCDFSLSMDDYIDRTYFCYENTDATKIARLLISKLREYATFGVAKAKALKSSSVDNWALILDILRQSQPKAYSITPIKPDICAMILDNERKAADRLRLDAIIAGIEPLTIRKAR